MRMDTFITLDKITYTEDAIGNQVEELVSQQVYAAKKAVRQSEFYQAASSGLKPEVTLIIWTFEYDGEQKLVYNNKTYSVIRTYERPDRKIELTCEVKSGG